MTVLRPLVKESIEGDFCTKIYIPINTEGYNKILGVALRIAVYKNLV
jgi:hypothetical protein